MHRHSARFAKMKRLRMLLLIVVLTCCARSNNGHSVVHMQQDDQEDASSQISRAMPGFAFASYYGNNMVLQQAPHRAVIWGTYPYVGERIIVKVSGLVKSYSAVVTASQTHGLGVWTVTLDPIGSGGPFGIKAFGFDGASISLNNVLFGDVWVCSGQSNMQFSTDQIFNASKELNESRQYTNIRLFTVAMKFSPDPQPDLPAIAEPWSLPKPSTVGNSPFNYFSAVCWLFGKLLYKELGYPIGLIDTTWGGTPVEAWSSPDALARCGVTQKVDQTRETQDRQYTELVGPGDNSVLWNAMVHPLLKMTIYGAIWYQGEADASEAEKMNRYNCTFPAMIDDWRSKFSAASQQTKPDFPFGFVQLSGNRPDMSVSVGFPDIRWHQTADYGYVPNPRMTKVFMAVSMDLPDFTSPWGSIHPRDKQDVAQRLFTSGLLVAYNRSSQWPEGPRPMAVRQQGDKVVLTYAVPSAYPTIKVLSRQGFELCCSWNGEDQCTSKNAWWQPTSILSNNITAVLLDGTVCGSDQFITALRYSWRESPCLFKKCAVYAYATDLPAPPFVTVKPKNSSTDFSYTIDWSKPQLIPE